MYVGRIYGKIMIDLGTFYFSFHFCEKCTQADNKNKIK